MGLGLLDFIAGMIDKKPKVPNAPNVNAEEQTRSAISANQQNLGALKTTANDLNTFNFDQLQGMLRKSIPGYDNLLSKTRGVIDSQLSGEIPQDVQDQIQRSGAVRSIGGGYGGSGMNRNLVARDLGLTSLDLTNRGLDSASKWIATARQSLTPQLFDITSMFIKPETLIQNEWNNEQSKFQREMVSNQLDQQYSWQHQLSEGIRADSANLAEITKSAAGSMLGGAMCWIAREVFGENNPEWKQFRNWLLLKSPQWFFNFYNQYGERIAEFIKDKPVLKAIIRTWMRSRIKNSGYSILVKA
jgi:hypothetical protein